MRGLGQAAMQRLRWPMVFELRECDESLLGRSSHEFDLGWDYDAEPELVHRTFLGFMGESYILQVVETTPLPGGGTHLRYRVAYDVPPLFAPLHPPVASVFRRWFTASLRGLQHYLDAHPRG